METSEVVLSTKKNVVRVRPFIDILNGFCRVCVFRPNNNNQPMGDDDTRQQPDCRDAQVCEHKCTHRV